MLNEERDRLANLAVAALRAGVAERLSRPAEQQGRVVANAIRQYLDALLTAVVALVERVAPANGSPDGLVTESGQPVAEVTPRHLRL
jgi:hypothetical protein